MLVTQWCTTVCDLRDCSPPGSSGHGILQAKTLEWVPSPFTRASSQPRDWTQVSCSASRFFTIWITRENLENSAGATGLEKVKKGNPKECSNYCTIALISHASKVMIKILQARLQQYVNLEVPDVQAGFRKGRGTRDQIANIYWIIEKAREFQKSIHFCFTDCAKAFDCVDHNELSKILQEMGIPDTLTWGSASWEACMQVRKQ